MTKVLWPDKSTQEAPTFEALFAGLNDEQMIERSERDFRRELRRRCKVWSETEIVKGGTHRELFYELERAGLLLILDAQEDTAECDETP